MIKVLIYLAFSLSLCLASENIVKTSLGTLKGFKEESINGKEFVSFQGIPFAEPPIGELRLSDPVPAKPWQGILEANELPPKCLQFNMMKVFQHEYIAEGQEDCLYLNVYTSKPNDQNARLPVMVFVHGGGYVIGSSHEYLPHVLMNEDIVFVVIHYRLSLLGFLSTDNDVIPGNYGLKDQVMALKWVKEHIANFGGDPDRVTIFGESAGAGSVHHLMLTPWAKDLFQGVIAQSGTATASWGVTRKARKHAQTISVTVKCPLTEENDEEFLKCLRSKDPEDLLQSTKDLMVWSIAPMVWLPNIDGDFLPEEPIVLLKENRYNQVNLISGRTRNEGQITAYMLSLVPNMTEKIINEFDTFAPALLQSTEEENESSLAKTIFDYYLDGNELSNETMVKYLGQMFTDRMFSVANDVATVLHSQNPQIKVYKYQLDHVGKLSLGGFIGDPEAFGDYVGHGDDLFYFFYGGEFFNNTMTDPVDLKLRDTFHKLWTNFAATGNPTPPGDSLEFTWQPTTVHQPQHLSINPVPTMVPDNFKNMKFWLSLPLHENKYLKDEKHKFIRERTDL